MEEIADLIRLLAEAPMEEPPMSRPKNLIDRFIIERVAQEGVVQPGPAVPDARPSSPERVVGLYAEPTSNQPQSNPQANPAPQQSQVGATADPKTGTPVVGMAVSVKPAEPFVVGEARVTTAVTMAGRAATPAIMEQLASIPANVRQQGPVEAKASPTPKANVTVVVPPAFPFDPAEAFRMVDEMELPPWKGSDRNILPFRTDADLESTEQLVARQYTAMEGNRSDVDRWQL